ncbi:MAG TPA: universal stress protein [Dehalococcoidia bacterium]|nr:universal stress protein [Dehalococcoidia bacterium]
MPALMEIKKILVPVSGGSADEEAINLACNLARKLKTKVYAAYVIEVERDLPLDTPVDSETEKAEEILTHAEDIATKADYDIETDLLQARETGPAIVDEAVGKGVDLIVMGIDYKKRLGVFDLGEAVSYILKEAHCQVLLYREPFPQE